MIKEIASSLSRISIIPVIVLFCITPAHLEASSHTGSGEKQEQAKKIESQLFSQKGKLNTVYSQEKDLLAELDVLEKDVEEKRRSMAKVKKMIRLAANEVKGLQGKLGETQRASRNAESRLAHKMVNLYKYARKGYVRLVADVRDMDQFRRRVKYLKVIIREDRRELVRLTQDASRQQSEVSQAEKILFQKKEMIDEKKYQLSSLKKGLEKKAIRLMKVHKEKEFYETAVRELQLAAKDLRKTLSKVQEKDPHEMFQTSSFREAKGKLPLPLGGKIFRSSRSPGSSKLSLHEGVFINGSSDPEVRAIFPGRVDFSGKLVGYGEIIILNHGSRFFTISALLRKRDKKEGDVVSGGEVIGVAGGSGSSARGRLYFEIRRGGKNLDPLVWLKTR